mgnify:CR=1 FL=1
MTIKIGKKAIITGAVILIALALYNVFYFVIPFNRDLSNGAFWVSYGFTTFFFVFAAFIVFLGVKDKELKLRIFGISLVKLAIGTCIAQLVVDAVVMGVGNWFAFPTWVAAVADSVIAAYVFVAVITRFVYKGHIEKIDSYEKKESFVKELRVELETLNNTYASHELAKEINGLFELAKYTDPVSNREVEPLEDEISSKVEVLKKQLEAGDAEAARQSITKIDSLLKERKLRVKNAR